MLIIDRRELQEHQDIPELIELPFVIDTLEGGDYAFLSVHNEPVGIERCDIGNLAQKLRSGELEFQLRKCVELYSTIYLLTEGVYDQLGDLLAIYGKSHRGYFRKFVYPNTLYDYIIASLVRLEAMGIRTVHTPTFDCTMRAVRVIYNQNTKPDSEHHMFQRIRPIQIPVKLSANPAVPRLMSLCPRLPEKVAIRLINKYDSIWNILQLNKEELLTVEGMGRGLVAKLMLGVGKE